MTCISPASFLRFSDIVFRLNNRDKSVPTIGSNLFSMCMVRNPATPSLALGMLNSSFTTAMEMEPSIRAVLLDAGQEIGGIAAGDFDGDGRPKQRYFSIKAMNS